MTAVVERILDAAHEAVLGNPSSGGFMYRMVVQLAAELMLGPFTKSRSFEQEQECRLFAWSYPRAIPGDNFRPQAGRKARVGTGGFTPYMPVTIKPALSSVMLGPAHHEDFQRQRYGLRSALSSFGYYDATICVSDHPYRS